MKLRLNLPLRAALMACYTMVAPLATTLFTGALIASPQALAADSDEEDDDVTASIAAAEADAVDEGIYDLGNVMYVGDSITHGGSCQSYRYNIHTILVDNGLTYNSIGIMEGDWSAEQSPDSYGGVTYTNIHNSESGGTATAVAGNADDSRDKFGDSNIHNWLGLSDTTADGTDYVVGETMYSDAPSGYDVTLDVFSDSVEGSEGTPDVYYMMIGTNDLSSNWNTWDGTSSATLSNVGDIADLYYDMDTIYAAVREASADCTIIIGTIPVWSASYTWASVNDTGRQAVYAYNQSLYDWAESLNDENLIIIDMSVGMVDVTLGVENYKGVADMYYDGLHPSDQGNLIFAANFAKGAGYAGGTAGQYRQSETEFAVNFFVGDASYFGSAARVESKGIVMTNTTVTASTIQLGGDGTTSTLYYAWQDGEGLSNGATVDFNLTFGDGATDGWNTADDLLVIMGNDSYVGALSIDEGYISWGGSILYSLDTSTNEYNLRLAWVNGESEMGLESGFYLWLDDMLIGSALQGTSGSYVDYDGVTFTYDGDGVVLLNELSIDGTQSYAPTTDGLTNEDGAYYATADNADGPSASDLVWNADGSVVWTTESVTASLTASGADFGASAQIDDASGDLNIVVDAGSSVASRVYGSYGSYTGDIWVEINSGGLISSSVAWYGAHGCGSSATGSSWVVDGNVFLKFSGDATGSAVNADGSLSGSGATVLGAINGGTVNGCVYLEFSAENLHLGNGYSGFGASVAGTYNSNVNGDMHMVFNAGTFENAIYGGTIGDTASTIGGATYIDINGGTFNGNVYGGGSVGTIGSNLLSSSGTVATNVSITDGTINANVYGGGTGGTITGNTSVTLSGGTITGDVYGGGTGGTITGSSSVTIDGSDVILHDGSNWGTVSTGGTSTISGSQSLTIKNVSDSETQYGFDKFAGTLTTSDSVNSQISFENVQVSNFAASITNFNTMSIGGGCDITLSNSSGITVNKLVLDSNLSLTIAEGSSMTITSLGSVFVNYDSCSIVNHGTFSFTTDTVIDPASFGSLISGDGSINIAGTWDVSSASVGGAALADFDANSIVLNDGLVLSLGSGLADGTYSLFAADSATGLDNVSIRGLDVGQSYSLSFDDGILSLILSQVVVMTWNDATDSFGDGDTTTSYLELNSDAAALTVALSEDITGYNIGMAGSHEITISGHELSATGGISIAVSNLNLAEGGSLTGEMSFTGATAIDAGNIDIAATASTRIDGSIGFNSLSGDISNASISITGAASMSDVTADSSTSIALSAALSLAGETSLSNVSLSSGASFITEAGASVSVNGSALSYSSAASFTALRHDLDITLGADSTLSQNVQYWLASSSSSVDMEVNINGSGTYELTSMLLRYTDTGDVTLNINDEATMHITNTKTTTSTSDAYSGFVVSGAKGVNGESIVNVSGTLQLDSGIVAFGAGNGTINVLEGGDLVLNRGTLSYSAGGSITIDVEGGTVQLGNSIDDSYTAASASDDLSVLSLNLYDGASIYGTGVSFSSSGFTTTTSTDIYQSLSIAESGTINIGTASGSTVNLYSNLSDGDYSATLNVTGGSLNLAGGASLDAIRAVSGSTLNITSAVSVGSLTADALSVTGEAASLSMGAGSAVSSITQSSGLISFTGSTTVGSLNTGTSSNVTNLSVSGDGTVVTVNGGATTSAASVAKTLSGDYTIALADGATYSENSKFYFNNATMTVSGDGTYKQSMMILSASGGVETTLNVGTDAVMEITSAATSASYNTIGFWICVSGTSRTDVTIAGTLIVNGMIVDRTGTGMSSASTMTVNDGGTLQLNDGLYASSVYTTGVELTVESGGTLALGNQADTTEYQSEIAATMKSGSILKAMDETTHVYTTLSYAEGATVNFDGNGNGLIMHTAVSGTNLAATISGNVSLAGGATLASATVNAAASLTIAADASIANTTVSGAMSIASGASLTGDIALTGGSLSVAGTLSNDISVTAAGSSLNSSTDSLTLESSITLGAGLSLSLSDVETVSLGSGFALDLSGITLSAETTYTVFTELASDLSADAYLALSNVVYDADAYEIVWDYSNDSLSFSLNEISTAPTDPWDGDNTGGFTGSDEPYVFDTEVGDSVVIGSEGATTAGASFEGGGSIEISGEGAFTSTSTIEVTEGTNLAVGTQVSATDGIKVTEGSISLDEKGSIVATDVSLAEGSALKAGNITVTGLDEGSSITGDNNKLAADELTAAAIAKAEVAVTGDASLTDTSIDSGSKLMIDGATLTADNSTIESHVSMSNSAVLDLGDSSIIKGDKFSFGAATLSTQEASTFSVLRMSNDAVMTTSLTATATVTAYSWIAGSIDVDSNSITNLKLANGALSVDAGSTLTLNNVTLSNVTITSGTVISSDALILDVSDGYGMVLSYSDATNTTLTSIAITALSGTYTTVDGMLTVAMTMTDAEYAAFSQAVIDLGSVDLTIDGIANSDLDDMTIAIMVNGTALDLSGSTVSLSNGVISLDMTIIPEPSTATLSLLALAGLLARRRRKG